MWLARMRLRATAGSDCRVPASLGSPGEGNTCEGTNVSDFRAHISATQVCRCHLAVLTYYPPERRAAAASRQVALAAAEFARLWILAWSLVCRWDSSAGSAPPQGCAGGARRSFAFIGDPQPSLPFFIMLSLSTASLCAPHRSARPIARHAVRTHRRPPWRAVLWFTACPPRALCVRPRST